MSHFKYEINERNLRMQLKENTVPFNEEAWQRFENFSASQKNHGHENAIKGFNLSLNRNIVLPVVFGAVIVLFSLLLFNFVNIKNPNQETAETKPVASVEVPTTSPVQQQVENSPIKAESLPVEIKDTLVKTITPPDIKKEESLESNPVASVHNPVILVKKSADQPDSEVAKKQDTPEITTAIQNSAISDATPRIEKPRKKRGKRSPVVTEASVEEDAEAPPPVSQNPEGSEQMQ